MAYVFPTPGDIPKKILSLPRVDFASSRFICARSASGSGRSVSVMGQFYSFAALSPHSQAAAQMDHTDRDRYIHRGAAAPFCIDSSAPALSNAKTFRLTTPCEQEKDHCPRDRQTDQCLTIVTHKSVTEITENVKR